MSERDGAHGRRSPPLRQLRGAPIRRCPDREGGAELALLQGSGVDYDPHLPEGRDDQTPLPPVSIQTAPEVNLAALMASAAHVTAWPERSGCRSLVSARTAGEDG